MGFWLILLQILKWTGIVIAGIIGLILLVILLILFVPFRYRLEGEKYKNASARGRVTWLLHLVRFTAEYKGGTSLVTKLKVLFFTVVDSTSEVKDDTDITDEDLENSEDYQDLIDESSEKPTAEETVTETPKPSETVEETATETSKPPETAEEPATESHKPPEAAEESATGEKDGNVKKEDKTEEKKERRTVGEILQDINDKVLDILEKPQHLIDRIYILEKKRDLITAFVDDPQNRRTVSLAKKTVVKLLKAILPRKGQGNIRFGTGDPASTGQILGGLALLYVQLGGSLKVRPEFDEKVFEGEGFLKGRIYLIRIVLLALCFWFNRDFKASKAKFEKLKKQLKKADKNKKA